MGEPQTVRYLYARRRTGEVVSAEELTRDSDLGDEVLECWRGRPMIPCWKQRQALSAGSRLVHERNLLTVGKALFQQVYSHCLTHEFLYHWLLGWRQCALQRSWRSANCPHVRRLTSLDISAMRRVVLMALFPICCDYTTASLFIEIAVTHLSGSSAAGLPAHDCSERQDDLPIERLLIEEQGGLSFQFQKPVATSLGAPTGQPTSYLQRRSAIAMRRRRSSARQMHPYAFYNTCQRVEVGVYRAWLKSVPRGPPIRNFPVSLQRQLQADEGRSSTAVLEDHP